MKAWVLLFGASIAGACAQGGDLEGPGGTGATGGSATDAGGDEGSAGSAGGGAAGAAGGSGVSGSAGVSGTSATGGDATPDGAPDAPPDSVSDVAADVPADTPVNPGDADACPGQTLTFSGSAPYTASVSGGTPPTNDTQGTCGGMLARDGVYRFTPPASGLATINFSTTAFDGLFFVRTTCALPTSEMSCIDAVAGQGTETFQFQATQGLDYYVWTDGVGMDNGLFALEVTVAPSEPVDDCPGEPVVFSGSGTADRVASLYGDTSIRWPDTDGCGVTGGRDEVWEITADTDGILTVTVTPSGPWDAAIYLRETTCATGTEVGCQKAAAAGAPETIEIRAAAGSKYYLVVDGADSTQSGVYALNVRLSPEKEHEDCPGKAVTFMGSASPRTFTEMGDTSVLWNDLAGGCGGDMAKDAVYAVSPPANGTLTLTLTPTGSFDGILKVRDSLCTGSDLACQSAMGPGSAESYSFLADQTKTYYAIVEGAGSSSGAYTLSGSLQIAAAPERCPGEFTTFSGSPGSFAKSGDLSTFVADYAGSCSANTAVGKDAVYRFSAATAGTVTVTIVPTGFDAAIYVRSTDCVSGTQVACRDSNGFGTGEQLTFVAVVGTWYYIFVDAVGATAGTFNLTVSY